MDQVDPSSTARKGLWATVAIAAVTGASAVTIALPATSTADPTPTTPSTTAAPPAAETPTPVPPSNAPQPVPGSPTPNAQPADPNAAPPPVVDPNAPPADPNAPPPDPNTGRITNAVGGFSFVLPGGWVESDASHLDYGSALLSKTTGPPPMPGQPAPVANDTRIVLGRLDQKLYASAEATNPKAAVRLGSDMGEFFMPYPGTRINQEAAPLNGTGGGGSGSFYEVKFSDTNKPNGQIWTGVVGSTTSPNGGPPQRWFVVWLGTSNDPVDKGAAKALAESILPSGGGPAAPGAPAPGAAAPAPGAPAAPAPAAPAPAPAPAAPAPAAGAPAPAPAPAAPAPAPAPGAPAPAPAPVPGQAPAGEATPTPTPTPQPVLPA
jgi:hypothetical protein